MLLKILLSSLLLVINSNEIGAMYVKRFNLVCLQMVFEHEWLAWMGALTYTTKLHKCSIVKLFLRIKKKNNQVINKTSSDFIVLLFAKNYISFYNLYWRRQSIYSDTVYSDEWAVTVYSTSIFPISLVVLCIVFQKLDEKSNNWQKN